jgi:pyrimidine operon attenuation protein/uracil phosphoribosyltransferase
LAAAQQQLPKTVADTVKTIENELVAIRDSSRMATVFLRLSKVWQRNGQLPLSAYYMGKQLNWKIQEKTSPLQPNSFSS